MFAIHGNRLPVARSYDAARCVFENAEPFDKDVPDTRWLTTKREWEKRVVKDGDSYRFIYHHTSVVIWDSEAQVRLTPYDSMSTTIFAGRFLPTGVDYRAGRSKRTLTLNHTEVYQPNRELRLVRDGAKWAIHPDDLDDLGCVSKFYRYDITDHKTARVAREKVKDYLAWVKVAKKDRAYCSGGMSDAVLLARYLVGGGEDYSACFERYGVPAGLSEAALVVAGVVKKSPAPLGTMPRSRFDGFSSYLD